MQSSEVSPFCDIQRLNGFGMLQPSIPVQLENLSFLLWQSRYRFVKCRPLGKRFWLNRIVSVLVDGLTMTSNLQDPIDRDLVPE